VATLGDSENATKLFFSMSPSRLNAMDAA
jgi:hypothetical protein